MDSRQLGVFVLACAAVLAVVGVLLWTGALSWFGKLPGDIRIETENTRVTIPLVSMLIVSAVVSLVLWLVRR